MVIQEVQELTSAHTTVGLYLWAGRCGGWRSGSPQSLVENSYDIVFTDLSMPRMSGFQLIQKMQQQFLQQPIIVMSAHDDDVLRQALGTYKIDYLIKPIIFEE